MKNIEIKSPDTPLTTVCAVNDTTQAELIKNMLVDHGIKAELAGEQQGGFTGVFRVEIIVREKDAQQAAEFIKTHFPEV